MAYDTNLPVAYLQEGPSSNQLDLEEAVILDYAEPSGVMLFATRWWKRAKALAKITVAGALIGGYPLMVAMSSSIDDSPVELVSSQGWAVPMNGVVITLAARELEGSGWAQSRHYIHPQSRLTALPAWQSGIVESLSDHTRLLSVLAAGDDGLPDHDLGVAARLFPNAEGEDMRARITAAAESLNRFDGKVAAGLVSLPSAEIMIGSEAQLFADWAEDSQAALSAQINREVAEWPASNRDIEVFYTAKARAHVAEQILSTLIAENPKVAASAKIGPALEHAQSVWQRAASHKPLLVSNQRGGAFLGNNMSAIAFDMAEARTASRAIVTALEEAAAPAPTVQPSEEAPAESAPAP